MHFCDRRCRLHLTNTKFESETIQVTEPRFAWANQSTDQCNVGSIRGANQIFMFVFEVVIYLFAKALAGRVSGAVEPVMNFLVIGFTLRAV